MSSYAASSASSAQPTSIASASTQVPFNWHSDSSPLNTSASFPPPSAPLSFAGSAISSIKPSSSISNHVEKSLKQKADDDNCSMVSLCKSHAIDEQFEKFGNMCKSISDSVGYLCEVAATMKSKKLETKVTTVPTHPVVHVARQKLKEMDKDGIPSSDMIYLFWFFHDNQDFADGYIQLLTDPKLANTQQGWLLDGLEELKH
ncbi:hypothetical protein BKA83DRAFT_4501515 [Pisolithus microcarpus]|nr:hypothetical protein BKA83DRAFT_4501515 [Pisolithus microcarpus]